MNKFKLAVYIGRFQPFHLGHKAVVEQALELADNLLIIVGSSNQPRTDKNMFTFDERAKMIAHSCDEFDNIKIAASEDRPYNTDRWVTETQNLVCDELLRLDLVVADVVLVGHTKDDSSFYLDLFPEYSYTEIGLHNDIHGTEIRNAMMKSIVPLGVLPSASYDACCSFVCSDDMANLHAERLYIEKEQKKLDSFIYRDSLNCNTADAVIICRDHILMVERANFPFKGCLALPGGHKEANETFYEGALRELIEEVEIDVERDVLIESTMGMQLFDDPNRDPVCCKPTVAYIIELEDFDVLPSVKTNDITEVAVAKWIPLDELDGSVIAFDHLAIIQTMTGI